MKKTSIRLGLAVAFSALLFTACKKDNEEAPASLTKESLAGKYMIQNAEVVLPVGAPISIMAKFGECEKDNIYTLNADFTAKYEDAGKSCGGDPVETTTWKLEGKNITVQGGSQDFIGVVKSWDGKTLVIDCVYEYMGASTTLRGTLSRQ